MHNLSPKRTFNLLTSFLFLPILSLLVSCGTREEVQNSPNIEQTIIDLEREALDNWSHEDPLGMSVNYAEDVTYFDDISANVRLDGLEEVKSHFASLKGAIIPHTYELVDTKVQSYGNTAILTLRYYATDLDGVSAPPWKATSIYRFADGEWKVIHAHWSTDKE